MEKSLRKKAIKGNAELLPIKKKSILENDMEEEKVCV
jgi:hypothetical protein